MRRVAFATALLPALLWPCLSWADVPEVGGELGFSQRSLYLVPIELGSFTVALGGRTSRVAYTVPLGVDWGGTLEGLRVIQGRLGFLVEAIVGRARFGGGLGVGFLAISRVTRVDSFNQPYAEAVLRTSADIVRFGEPRVLRDGRTTRAAFYVASELRVNTALVWGPSLFLGVRY
ncbi:MAG TPA: hypothetical protein VF316_09110 [Polyangiaceae bacterium]